ncbi:MAG TPA: plastocyanin/azurin family copper-binding protein [Conexibacter sp.]|nr:plastocyanin/azurin family copper-binding protein [Conexibacter sp.]
MRRIGVLPALLTIGALALAGCGGGGGGGNDAATTTGGGSSSSSSGGGGTTAVAMKNIAFAPTSVTVKVGQKITWTNDDSVAHNVTATSGASFRSSDFSQGGTFSYTATKAGTIHYVCTIHPGMDGTIVVTR